MKTSTPEFEKEFDILAKRNNGLDAKDINAYGAVFWHNMYLMERDDSKGIGKTIRAITELRDMRENGAMERGQDDFTMLLMLWLRTTSALDGLVHEIRKIQSIADGQVRSQGLQADGLSESNDEQERQHRASLGL